MTIAIILHHVKDPIAYKKKQSPGGNYIDRQASMSLASEIDVLQGECFLLDLGLFPLMAMAISLGKRSWSTNAWSMVEMSRTETVSVEMPDSTTESISVSQLLTSAEYLIVAMATPVIGKV